MSKACDTSPTTFLDGLRGLAAFYVLVGHARYILHEGNPGYRSHPGAYSSINKAIFYALASFRYGHEAVIFFFVLSGFVIHLRYSRQLLEAPATASFGWYQYFYRRARRLYPPLILALVLTFAMDRLGIALGFPIYSGHTPYEELNLTLVPDHRWLTALGNLVFLMTVYVPAFGTDGPLWSLMYEWWFYGVYPLLWRLTKWSIAVATAVVAGLFWLSFYHSLWPLALLRVVCGMLIVWWMGALLADVYTGRLRIPMKALAPLALLIPLCVALSLPSMVLGLGFTGLIAAGFYWQSRNGRLTILNALKPLGEMSYTLYVTHMPIVVFLGGWLMTRSPDHALPRGFGFVLIGVAICLIFAWLAHLVVERPFIRPARRAPMLHAAAEQSK